MQRSNTRLIFIPALLLTAMVACKQADQQTTQVATNQDSVLTQQTAILQQQKDSLLDAAKSLFDAMSSIDSADALAGYKASKHSTEPAQSYEVQVRDRTLKALARLRVAEARLKTSVSKVSKLSTQNAQLNTQLAQFRETANSLQQQMRSQHARVDTLMYQLAVAKRQNDSLAYSNWHLASTVDSFSVASRRAFFVTGTKKYLLQHSIVNEVGGSRFPFIVKLGSTLRPVSAHVDTSLFVRIDKQADVIPLDSTREYEIVSAQDLDGVDRSNADGRVFHGSIHILDPQRFWKPSAFLILRQL